MYVMTFCFRLNQRVGSKTDRKHLKHHTFPFRLQAQAQIEPSMELRLGVRPQMLPLDMFVSGTFEPQHLQEDFKGAHSGAHRFKTCACEGCFF